MKLKELYLDTLCKDGSVTLVAIVPSKHAIVPRKPIEYHLSANPRKVRKSIIKKYKNWEVVDYKQTTEDYSCGVSPITLTSYEVTIKKTDNDADYDHLYDIFMYVALGVCTVLLFVLLTLVISFTVSLLI